MAASGVEGVRASGACDPGMVGSRWVVKKLQNLLKCLGFHSVYSGGCPWDGVKGIKVIYDLRV